MSTDPEQQNAQPSRLPVYQYQLHGDNSRLQPTVDNSLAASDMPRTYRTTDWYICARVAKSGFEARFW
ncbi:hypothetical protein N7457_000460 [Penicillium paradoxum]|uniref:uncharacterized protein n=1 Tax=Penicillium paradoxum TaxID=176176 RepID=UPI0025483334|nr:uncharacterized protein N7457_000460 [Penicillium paradoxum]KAJ5793861.1 hypothetical protein N7457_000460 [Penicillium paradoxum]